MLVVEILSSGLTQAQSLGLSDAVLCAKAEVQARKARLMAKIHAAHSARDLSKLRGLQEPAVQLGLADGLQLMQKTLQDRARAAESKLQHAAQTADKLEFDACIQVVFLVHVNRGIVDTLPPMAVKGVRAAMVTCSLACMCPQLFSW